MNTRAIGRIILAPLSLLYGLVIGMRNMFYDTKILKSSKFNIPVIGIGNISMGGSGKTPHVEFLIKTLRPYLKVGTLSRGYQRKTSGYLEVEREHNVDLSGDEALQYKLKFPDVVVAVAEQRALGIPMMVGDHPNLQAIILDDAFQHRSVSPSLNILITDFKEPYFNDFLLPGGRLREWRSADKRADVIIVSKCPPEFSIQDKEEWLKKLKPEVNQKVFFSYYEYGSPYFMYQPNQKVQLDKQTDVVLLSGIAKPIYLQEYLEPKVNFLNVHAYEDHHQFNPHEVSQVKRALQELQAEKKIVITTEKDSIRLDKHRDFLMREKLPIFIIPVQVKFFDFNEEPFDQYIKDFLINFQS